MTQLDNDTLKTKVNDALDRAESIYSKVEDQLRKELMFSNESVVSDIPDFPLIKDGEPSVADFIALVLDVRGSTNNLLQACSSSKVQQLERTLYESTAVNSMGAFVINKHKGGVTEFLGDGFLALFRTKKNDDVHYASNAAKDCLKGLSIVNQILNERYQLPPLKVGIGLAYSQAIVMLIEANGKFYPKALGECVYRASKLSTEFNEILMDKHLRYYWPTTQNGTLKFVVANNKHKNTVQGYKLEKSS